MKFQRFASRPTSPHSLCRKREEALLQTCLSLCQELGVTTMQLFPHHKKVAKQAHGVAHKIVQAAPSPPAVLSLHQWLHPRTGQHAAFEQPPTAPELQSNNEQTNNATVLRIPRDQTLDKMDIILTKTMRGLTVTEFYDWVWKETKGPLYQPWLEESGKQIVQVHEWKPSTTAGSWDQESYQEERMVQFEFGMFDHEHSVDSLLSCLVLHLIGSSFITSFSQQFVRHIFTQDHQWLKYPTCTKDAWNTIMITMIFPFVAFWP